MKASGNMSTLKSAASRRTGDGAASLPGTGKASRSAGLEPANKRLRRSSGRKPQAKAELEKGKAWVNDSMLSMRDWGWEVDADGAYTHISQKGLDALGLPREAVIGKTPFDYMAPDEARRVAGVFAGIVAAKAPIRDLENWVLGKNGEVRCMLTNGEPILDKAGNLKGYRGVDRDITMRKQVEEKLRQTADRLALAVRAGGVGIWEYDVVNNRLIWDEQMSRLYGIRPDPSRKAYEDWHTGVHPEDRPRGDEEIQQALRGEKDFDTEFRVLWPDGTIRNIRALAVVQRDAAGKPLRMIGTNWDITAQKQREEETEEMLWRQQQINLVQQSLLTPARLEDKLQVITDQIVRLFNADFCRIWLIRPGNRCGQDCIHAEGKDAPHSGCSRTKCLHLLASSGRYNHTDSQRYGRVPLTRCKFGRIAMSDADHKFLTNDLQNDPDVCDRQWARELGLVSFAGYQLRVPEGEPLGVLAIFAKHPIQPREDAALDAFRSTAAIVIQQATAEEAVKVAQQQVIETAQMKTAGQLAAGVAHEIKNPLAIALMGMEYLSSMVAANHDTVKTVLKDSMAALQQADAIVRELLNFAAPAKLELKRQDLNVIVERALAFVRYAAQKRHVLSHAELGKCLPFLQLDQKKIEQTLVNLYMNAIEAMPEGGTLLVKTRAHHLATGVTEVVAEVEDTGPGVAPENLVKIFEPFFSKSLGGKGTGLGLPVARQILHMHGGTIRINNRPEGGARVTLTFVD